MSRHQPVGMNAAAPNWYWGELDQKQTLALDSKGYPDIYYLVNSDGTIAQINGNPAGTWDAIASFAAAPMATTQTHGKRRATKAKASRNRANPEHLRRTWSRVTRGGVLRGPASRRGVRRRRARRRSDDRARAGRGRRWYAHRGSRSGRHLVLPTSERRVRDERDRAE